MSEKPAHVTPIAFPAQRAGKRSVGRTAEKKSLVRKDTWKTLLCNILHTEFRNFSRILFNTGALSPGNNELS